MRLATDIRPAGAQACARLIRERSVSRSQCGAAGKSSPAKTVHAAASTPGTGGSNDGDGPFFAGGVSCIAVVSGRSRNAMRPNGHHGSSSNDRLPGRKAPAAGCGAIRPWRSSLLAMCLVFATGAHRHVSLETLVRHRMAIDAFIDAHSVAAIAAFMAIYVLVVALSIPGAVFLTITGGILFGTLRWRARDRGQRDDRRDHHLPDRAQPPAARPWCAAPDRWPARSPTASAPTRSATCCSCGSCRRCRSSWSTSRRRWSA